MMSCSSSHPATGLVIGITVLLVLGILHDFRSSKKLRGGGGLRFGVPVTAWSIQYNKDLCARLVICEMDVSRIVGNLDKET